MTTSQREKLNRWRAANPTIVRIDPYVYVAPRIPTETMQWVKDLRSGLPWYFDTTCTIPIDYNKYPEYRLNYRIIKDDIGRYIQVFNPEDKVIIAPFNSYSNESLHPLYILKSEYHKVIQQFKDDMKYLQ